VKCDPVIADFAPTKGHSGRGVRSHIEEKSPKPIAAVARACRGGGGCCSRDAYGDGSSSRERGSWEMGVAEKDVRRWRACAGGGLCSERKCGSEWIIGRLPWLGCARSLREDEA